MHTELCLIKWMGEIAIDTYVAESDTQRNKPVLAQRQQKLLIRRSPLREYTIGNWSRLDDEGITEPRLPRQDDPNSNIITRNDALPAQIT